LHGIDEAWSLAGDLVAAGLDAEALTPLTPTLEGADLADALAWLASAYNVAALAHAIGHASERISQIVGALKGYAYLGQAPIQEVDLHEGIENTLIMLRSRLKYGVTVHRDFAQDLPLIPAYGSELNQVWTNILDNAADAMGEKGNITLRTRRDEPFAVVEIEDDGPGVPAEIAARIFDPFFTTKPPGKGQGLGLSTSYSIVVDKHGGQIGVDSRPGSTRFIVKLPLREYQRESQAAAGRLPDP
jgi:signal transduction histidine kinase